MAAAARGKFLLCLQEQLGHSNLCCFQVIRHLSPFFDNQRGLESVQQHFLQISMGKYPWILPAPLDFEHAALQAKASHPSDHSSPSLLPSTVSHQAGKFSIVPTAVSFGTSIAFFGAVSTPHTLFSFGPCLGNCHFSVVSLRAWAQGFLSGSQHRGEMVWQGVSSGLPVTFSNDTTGLGS